MKHISAKILKIAIIMSGLPIFAMSLIGLYLLLKYPPTPEYATILYTIVMGLYASTLPFYIGLYSAYRLLNDEDQGGEIFHKSSKRLKTIQYCIGAFFLIYVALLPVLLLLADKDDAPGIILIGFIPVFVAFVFGVFAAVFNRGRL